MMLAAKVWHYWIAVPLVLGGLGLTLSLVAGYLVRVVRPQYPRKSRP